MKLRDKMKRFWTLNVHNHEGFTLVELIIVIAILAILSSVAVVGYSSYVKKANKAADDALLYEINQAFRSACIENMCDVFDISKAVWDMDNMTVVSVEDDTTHPIITAFEEFFDVANPKFKVISFIWFDPTSGQWTAISDAYANLLGKLSPEDIAALKNSTFTDKFTVSGLLNKVNDVTDFAAFFGEDVYNGLFADENYMKSICALYGIDASELTGTALSQAYENAIQNAVAVKAASLAGVTVDELLADTDTYGEYLATAYSKVFANTAVLYAAENSNQNADELLTMLQSDTAKSDIKSSLQNDGYGVGLSNASTAFAMFVAYAYYTGDAELIENSNDYTYVLNHLNDPGFQAYLETQQAKDDLDGYLGAMNMVNNGASGDTAAVDNLLANGFSDPELIALLEQAMNNN